jgi:hypothetical protein
MEEDGGRRRQKVVEEWREERESITMTVDEFSHIARRVTMGWISVAMVHEVFNVVDDNDGTASRGTTRLPCIHPRVACDPDFECDTLMGRGEGHHRRLLSNPSTCRCLATEARAVAAAGTRAVFF